MTVYKCLHLTVADFSTVSGRSICLQPLSPIFPVNLDESRDEALADLPVALRVFVSAKLHGLLPVTKDAIEVAPAVLRSVSYCTSRQTTHAAQPSC